MNGIRTDWQTKRAIRERYAAGDSLRAIAEQFGLSRTTVRKACIDIVREAPKPMTVAERNEKLRSWR